MTGMQFDKFFANGVILCTYMSFLNSSEPKPFKVVFDVGRDDFFPLCGSPMPVQGDEFRFENGVTQEILELRPVDFEKVAEYFSEFNYHTIYYVLHRFLV
ncbi:hypothetical protein DdX_14689 [Ditylenchus destructor]|uniref:Uncharacterized protein n=1 Tax=Ditylenchus destructor TaxID=166010 RepID=A0AAD4MRF0_9BILA|nr:hypothetical protein DdX_14689 [Ditylenchus destructor]